MQGKVHVAIGVAVAACLAARYPTGINVSDVTLYPLLFLPTAAAGSYAPDIDMHRSHSGMKHKLASKVISKVGGGHRGITHTLLTPAILVAAMLFICEFLVGLTYIASAINSLIAGFLIGYVMHIIADMFNGKGVPLLWPLSKSKISLMDLPSSGFVPWVFAFILVACIAMIIFPTGVF